MATQKLYVYADESGQDAAAALFFVVAVASDRDQEALRQRIVQAEDRARTGHRKWHKIAPQRRLNLLNEIVAHKIGHGDVFCRSYEKPVPYFFPTLDVIELAILHKATPPYLTRVYVDGIDQKKARELTNALRARGIALEHVRSRRDESEPLIRLADLWAGCIRAGHAGRRSEQALLERARRSGYVIPVAQQKTPRGG